MSYSIRILEPGTKKTIQFKKPIDLRGGTYAVGGTTEAWLNITYNYSPHFRRVFGDEGIRSLYGKTGLEAAEMLDKAIPMLGGDVAANYWKPTEGNARAALMNLATLCRMAPDGIVRGD